MKKVVCLTLAIILSGALSFAEKATEGVILNEEVFITIMKDGIPVKEKISLKSDETPTNKEIMSRLSSKALVTWKDVAKLEADMATRDKSAKLMIDNLWAQRINRVVVIAEAKYGTPPTLDSVLSVLGIPKERLTGGEYVYVPGPDNNPPRQSRVTYRDVNLNTFLDPASKIADVNNEIEIPEAPDASRSK